MHSGLDFEKMGKTREMHQVHKLWKVGSFVYELTFIPYLVFFNSQEHLQKLGIEDVGVNPATMKV